jgi:hypothetical protein
MPKHHKKTAPALDNIVLELEENALDSLVHGVEHFLSERRPSDLKYAVLHVFQAVELYMKAKLASIHPILMLAKPEDHANPDPKSAEFGPLVKRIQAVGASVSEDDLAVLDCVRRRRNQIEHHRVSLNREDATILVGKTIRFLEEFMLDELGITLEDKVDSKIYQAVSEAIHSWAERLARAKDLIEQLIPPTKEALNYQVIDCPECGTDTIPVPNPRNSKLTECYLCGMSFDLSTCDVCGAHHIGGDICESCQENIFDSRDEHGGY